MSENGDKKNVVVRRRDPEKMVPWSAAMARFFDWPRDDFGIWPRRPGLGLPFEASDWLPDIDVFEEDGNLIVRADLPGMKKEDISVSITEDALIISGNRKQEKETDTQGFHLTERSVGMFSRTIRLPKTAWVDRICATYVDGVLEVKLPVPEAVEKKIDVAIA
jgi:HSP20 family protein